MAKIINLILAAALLAILLCGCNYDVVDTVYGYDKAIVKLPDGSSVSGKVQLWSDEDGDMVQVKINDTYYYTHGSNIVLIKGENK